jgi:hypothetical protein
MIVRFPPSILPCAAALLVLALAPGAGAAELSGLLDVRALRDDGELGWRQAGLGKTRFGGGTGVRLGQGILAGEVDISDAVSGVAVVGASDDRRGLVDVHEAWIGWAPVPQGPWKVRAKAGVFFPPLNQEIDYGSLTWTPTRTISASALNSWVGEELRTKGVELSLTHRGRASGSPHDVGVTAAVFNGNDPAGTLLAWRGWAVGDRITGLGESIRLADLPVYRADGAVNKQSRDIHLFREIDGRAGFYVGANYAYGEKLELSVLHYDNRGDPLVVKDGQYSWATKFNHAGLRLRDGRWEWMAQFMTGSTMMGANAVAIDYRAWYALASHPLGAGTLTLRYDQFGTREHDAIPADPNGEFGRSLALAYAHEITSSLSVVNELLLLRSERAARLLVGVAPAQRDTSITASLRWRF